MRIYKKRLCSRWSGLQRYIVSSRSTEKWSLCCSIHLAQCRLSLDKKGFSCFEKTLFSRFSIDNFSFHRMQMGIGLTNLGVSVTVKPTHVTRSNRKPPVNFGYFCSRQLTTVHLPVDQIIDRLTVGFYAGKC